MTGSGTALLDVNVLIALLDSAHVHHDPAHDWLAAHAGQPWATCPLTENGVLRVLGNPRYPNSPGAPHAVVGLLASLCRLRGHVHWPDSVSLLDTALFDSSRLLHFGQVTDSYLLGLARANGGRLVTLDRRLVTGAVHQGAAHLQLIG